MTVDHEPVACLDDVQQCVREGFYLIGPPSPEQMTNEERRAEFVQRREAARQRDRQFRSDLGTALEQEYGMTSIQAAAVVQYVWDQGHAYGYQEVLTYLSLVLDMLKPFLPGGQ